MQKPFLSLIDILGESSGSRVTFFFFFLVGSLLKCYDSVGGGGGGWRGERSEKNWAFE